MTPRDFCFWLQGFFEIRKSPGDPLTPEQIIMIEKHLNSVFEPKVGLSTMPVKEEGQQTGEDFARKLSERYLHSPGPQGILQAPKFDPPLTVTC